MIKLNYQTMDLVMKTLRPGGTLVLKGLRGFNEARHKKVLSLMFKELSSVKTLPVLDDEREKHELFYIGYGFKLNDTYQ